MVVAVLRNVQTLARSSADNAPEPTAKRKPIPRAMPDSAPLPTTASAPTAKRRSTYTTGGGGGGGGGNDGGDSTMKLACGLIISAMTSAAARINSAQSEPASLRSPARPPVFVASVSCQPVPARRIVASAERASGGGGT